MNKFIKSVLVGLVLIVVFIFSFFAYITWPALRNTVSPPKVLSFNPQFTVPQTILASGGYPDTAKGVLDEFLRLDAEGGYLSDKGEKYITELGPANGGKKTIMPYIKVIKGYKTKYLETKPDLVLAEVEYDLVGEINHLAYFIPASFTKERKTKKVSVALAKRNGKWILTTSLLYLYISVPTATDYIEKAAKVAETDKTVPRFVIERKDKLIREINMAAKLAS